MYLVIGVNTGISSGAAGRFATPAMYHTIFTGANTGQRMDNSCLGLVMRVRLCVAVLRCDPCFLISLVQRGLSYAEQTAYATHSDP